MKKIVLNQIISINGENNIPITTTLVEHTMNKTGVYPFNDGFVAHIDGPVGATLIGWYKTEKEALRALEAHKPSSERAVRNLFIALAFAGVITYVNNDTLSSLSDY